MNSEFWTVVFEGKNVNVLLTRIGYWIVDKAGYVISVNNERLGHYDNFKDAMAVIEQFGLEG